MNKKICVHCFISGKVQGVWFRAGVKDQADNLNITGWARNLSDGRVEVMASGEKNNIEQLHAWLKIGPPHAKVIEVAYEEVPWQSFDQFDVL